MHEKTSASTFRLEGAFTFYSAPTSSRSVLAAGLMSHNVALSCLKEILAPPLDLLLKKVLTSIGGGFLSISLDLHSTGDSAVSFTAGEIGHMEESVVESGLDVADTEVQLILVLVLRAGGSVVDNLVFFDNLWWLYDEQEGVRLNL